MAAPALQITVRYLQPFSHGRGEDGLPEWPPSPLRLFQALVAAAIGRDFRPPTRRTAEAALKWLERQDAPDIVAPEAREAASYRLYVPDNVGDRVAVSWLGGRESDIAEYRTEKDMHCVALSDEAVHFLFRNATGLDEHLDTLRSAARSITHLGLGIDMVVGDANQHSDDDLIRGERWIPVRRGHRALRWTVEGTFEALAQRHNEFLNRLDGGTFRPVSPLTVLQNVDYVRARDPLPRPFIAFRLLDPETGRRLSFDTTARSRDVAAWIRHAVGEIAKGWPFGPTAMLVHGHADPEAARATEPHTRLSFVTLPTITPRRTEGIGRVLITAPPDLEAPLDWLRPRLGGHLLVWQGRVIALLEPLAASDWVLRQYVGPSRSWSTVTPVVLPGHDDRSPEKASRLIERAFEHAGFTPDELATIEDLEWRKVGFRRGLAHASAYLCPDKVEGPRYHVRVRFSRPRSGPLAIGRARHRGLGVFAVDAI